MAGLVGLQRAAAGVAVCAMATFGADGHRADAGWKEPICRVPSVVDVMAHEMRRHDHYARIEAQFIQQYPAETPNIVLCGVWVQTLYYDARQFDGLPLMYTELHEFRVQALVDGYVVKLLR
jgi:hypothetical protein